MPKDEQLLGTAGDWVYVRCQVTVELPDRPMGFIVGQEGGLCQLCGNNNIKFLHTLEYLPDIEAGKHDAEVWKVGVGRDCARILLGEDEACIADRAEDETRRKRDWRIFYRRPGRCTTTLDDLDARGLL